MADRVLMITWGENVPGREERGLEVFNEVMGLYGRMQQDGRIESFDVALLNPGTGMDGYIALHGSADQLAKLRDEEDFRQSMYDAAMVVQDLKMVDGYTGAGIEREIGLYQQAISKVPQRA